MKFTVVALNGADTSVPVNQLSLPVFKPLADAIKTRWVSLNEEDSDLLTDVGPRAALLGTVDASGNPVPLMADAPVTENPGLNDTEIWERFNFTADAHPIHLHQVMFQVVDRQELITDAEGMSLAPAQLAGKPFQPEAWETGFKDTVVAYPGQVTRLKVKFDIPGKFVWHCHILEHENNQMMRPFEVVA